MHNQIIKNMRLLHLMENLKTETRQNWLSDGREESVAEHSWRLSLMVILFAPYLDQPINTEKALKMAIVHDIVVAETGYIPAAEMSERQKSKKNEERRAIQNVKTMLNNTVGQELLEIWQEFEDCQSYEAKFINALDKLETIIQQNEADVNTWVDWNIQLNQKAAAEHCAFDSYLSQFSQLIGEQVDRKLAEAGLHTLKIEKAS